MEPQPAFVALEGLSKAFEGVHAVRDLSLNIQEGEFFSLLGPSGCGKTTTLRLIAGLDQPDQGIVTISGEVVSGKGIWVAPERRGVGVVFQDYALFPHMDIYNNVAFGLRDLSRSAVKSKVMDMLEIVGLAGLASRYPHELSGGQRQRVALARSLAPSPRVILLDEPFSNLDADLRDELRDETKRILKEKGTTTILVTHDQQEAFSLSDRVGVLNNGRLEQVGTPAEIYHRPSSRFVADFVGKADFVIGWITGSAVVSPLGTFALDGGPPAGALEPAGIHERAHEQEVELMIRPDDIDFVVDPSGASVIAGSKFLGASILYTVEIPGRLLIHSMKSSTVVVPVGTKISVKVDATHIVVFPRL